MDTIEIDREHVMNVFYAIREAHEGLGASGVAAEMAIELLFDVLGEPGAGE